MKLLMENWKKFVDMEELSMADEFGVSDEEIASMADDEVLFWGPGGEVWVGRRDEDKEEGRPFRKQSHASMEPDYERDGALEEDKEGKGKRTAKGNITQTTREKYATVGKDGFPIFDKKSAKAAIDLRGHASAADQKKIINKAAKFAPEAAKKAREVEKNK
tara:strand:+ start:642 stop:1124 length:483 start_codon:yes stop_codon:yes gene_type:complete